MYEKIIPELINHYGYNIFKMIDAGAAMRMRDYLAHNFQFILNFITFIVFQFIN